MVLKTPVGTACTNKHEYRAEAQFVRFSLPQEPLKSLITTYKPGKKE